MGGALRFVRRGRQGDQSQRPHTRVRQIGRRLQSTCHFNLVVAARSQLLLTAPRPELGRVGRLISDSSLPTQS